MLCAARQPFEDFLAVLVERPCITFLKQCRMQLFKTQQKRCSNAREAFRHVFVVGCQELSECNLDKARVGFLLGFLEGIHNIATIPQIA